MLYLFTDLDRTLLPNGNQTESPASRSIFAKLAARPDVILTYVSGRSRELIQKAIDEFGIPEPDYAVGDVGTSIYNIGPDGWQMMTEWHHHINQGWSDPVDRIARKMSDVDILSLQEPEKQSRFKLSYYVDQNLVAEGERLVLLRLAELGVKTAIICSYDETAGIGFVDILPPNATKLHAVRFLMEYLHAGVNQTVYCGDSGNDLPVLTSDIQSVLVANAEEHVIKQAVDGAREKNCSDSLYIAAGVWGLNGNYSAGIIEGVAHFDSTLRQWLVKEVTKSV